jgi:hypothetical protein
MWVTSSGATDEDDGVSLGRWDGGRWAEVPLPDELTAAGGISVDIAAPDDIWVEGGAGGSAEGSGIDHHLRRRVGVRIGGQPTTSGPLALTARRASSR